VDGLAASVRDALAHAAKPRYFVTDGRRKTPAIDLGGRSLRRKIDPAPAAGLDHGCVAVSQRDSRKNRRRSFTRLAGFAN
jgi:hypothetical protein